MPRLSLSTSKTRRLVTPFVAAVLAGSTLTFATPAQALLPTSTSVTANPSASSYGDPVTLTASVSLSVLVTPLGYVDFKTNNGEATESLGSAQLGNCNLLMSCTATLTTTAIPVGTNIVTATYRGDSLSGSSSGTTTVVVTNPLIVATPANPYTSTCASGQPCSTPIVYSSDNQSAMQAIADPSSGSNSLTVYLGGSTDVPCFIGAGNQPSNFDSTATDVSKRIDFWVFDAYADAINAAIQAHGGAPHFCFASTTKFLGTYPDTSKGGSWSGGFISGPSKTGFVPYDKSRKLYYGLLPACNNTNNSGSDGNVNDQGNNSPCFVAQVYGASTFAGHTTQIRSSMIAPPGDPKLGP